MRPTPARFHPASRLLAAALVSAAPVAAQQRLFALDSANQIWRVDGHTTASGTLVPVVTVAPPAGTSVRDLAFDPTTQRFWVLAANATAATLLDVDPIAGTSTPLCTVGGVLSDGLDRRSDGVLVFEQGLAELVLVDPASCTVWRVPISALLGMHTSNASLTIDVRGAVATMAPDGSAYTVDPLDGQASQPPFAMFFTAHGYEAAANGDHYVAAFPWSLYRLAASPAQLWQVALTNPPTGATIRGLALEEPADGVGVAHVCDGSPNSTGRPSTLELVGSTVVGAGALELRCRDLPLGSLGYFLMGQSSGTLPVASGVLCIAPPVLRNSLRVLDSGSTGTVRLPFLTNALPVGTALQPGDQWVFQYWHRDTPSTANFSAARSVTFR